MRGVMTVGDIVYEFCKNRKSLKTFNNKRLYQRKVRRMINWTTEVVKAVSKESHLPFVEEFWRQAHYAEF